MKLSSFHVTWFTPFSYYQHCDGFCGRTNCLRVRDLTSPVQSHWCCIAPTTATTTYILCLPSTIAISIFLYSGILQFFGNSFSIIWTDGCCNNTLVVSTQVLEKKLVVVPSCKIPTIIDLWMKNKSINQIRRIIKRID